jgi:hypothetical protein
VLYEKFGNAWRVDEKSSLFDYPSWLTYKDFADEKWPLGDSPKSCDAPQLAGGVPPKPPAKPIPFDEAEKICDGVADKARLINCIQDVAATGEPGFADVYRQSDKLSRINGDKLEPPPLAFPNDNDRSVTGPAEFVWKDTAPAKDGKGQYRHCLWPADEEFGFQHCSSEGLKENRANTEKLVSGRVYFWKVIVEGDNGATAESETRRFTAK